MSTAVASNAKGGGGKGGSGSSGHSRRHGGHGGGGGGKQSQGKTGRKSPSPTTSTTTAVTASPTANPTQPPQTQPQAQTPPQASQSHPLHRRWTLWYDSPSTYNTDNWELSLLPIMTVSTVEDFFVMLRYMKPLHDLRTSSQYHFFQEGVKPMWEDPANKEGGKVWVNIEIPNTPTATSAANSETEEAKKAAAGAAASGTANATAATSGKSELDQVWERVLMALIGEYMEPSTGTEKEEDGAAAATQIVGVVMAKRKYHNRLALWVRDASNSAAIETLKKRLKEEAALPASASLVFTKHGESGAKN